jgi:hypothetical protein
MNRDQFLSAREAKDYGLVDQIVSAFLNKDEQLINLVLFQLEIKVNSF